MAEYATIAPVVGRDGNLLAVTVNGIVCVRSDALSFQDFADSILMRIASLPRDTTSDVARRLLQHDAKRVAELQKPLTPPPESRGE